MVKKDSNIDVLFRDGLSNIEFLPPESVWDTIEPVIRKKNSRGLFFRIAAGIAVLTSLGLMAYFLSGNIITDGDDPELTEFSYNLSTLFDASYIDIAVEAHDNSPLAENSFLPDASPEMLAAVSVTDNDYNSGNRVDGPVLNHQTIDLQYNTLDNTTLRFAELPDEVPAKNEYEFVLVPEMVPVEPADERKQRRWELGAMVSPTYLSTNLRTANEVLRQVNDNESPVLSYSGGFSVSYKMSGRLSIQTGLYYSSLGRKVQGVTSYSGFAPFASSKSGIIFGVETSSGTIASTNKDIYLADRQANRIDGYYSVDNFDPLKSSLVPFGNQLRQNFEYLQVPLIIRYKLIDRKIDFNILGGMAYNFLIGNQTWAMNDDGLKILLGSTEGVDNLLLSSSLGMSLEYELSKSLSLNLEPEVRYFLNTGGDLGSGNPYTFGVFSGMQFKF